MFLKIKNVIAEKNFQKILEDKVEEIFQSTMQKDKPLENRREKIKK